MSCDYCNGTKSLIERDQAFSTHGDFYVGIGASIEDATLYIESVADVYEPNWTETDVKINYCPMCGSKLRR